jgi:hypothetical protein
LLVGLFLWIQALAVLPALHALVHHDASDPGHECAVTLFAHGQVDASNPVVMIVCAAARPMIGPSIPAVIFVSTDVPLLPGRGPPAFPALV